MIFNTAVLVKRFPVLGVYKRHLLGLVDSLAPAKKSYSQYAEDEYLKQQLEQYNLKDGMYVDIGSNHPTRISNTYLFYRMGLRGIAIEPNVELTKQHNRLRPRDIVLNVGCGDTPSLGQLKVGKAPVLSHFQSNEENQAISEALGFECWRTEYVSILPLDLIVKEVSPEWIFLMSVDVEGLDYEVLKGAKETLSKVLFCCVEANNEAEEKRLDALLTNEGFCLLKKAHCNLIYVNQSDVFKKYCTQ